MVPKQPIKASGNLPGFLRKQAMEGDSNVAISANTVNESMLSLGRRAMALDDEFMIIDLYHLGYIKFDSQKEADYYLSRCRMANREKYSYEIIISK